LEGLEVVFIVLSFGGNQNNIGLASAAAGAAVVLVVLAGVVVRGPLARVPENALKFAVGVLLSSFGMFWGAEGAGASWPGGDAALLVIVPGMALISLAMVRALPTAPQPAPTGDSTEARRAPALQTAGSRVSVEDPG
jgi:uncharacterized membrane protein